MDEETLLKSAEIAPVEAEAPTPSERRLVLARKRVATFAREDARRQMRATKLNFWWE